MSAAIACAQAGRSAMSKPITRPPPPAAAMSASVASAPGLVGAVVDDDVEAVMRQAPGDGAADALAGAGDEDRAGHELAGLLISLVTSCGW